MDAVAGALELAKALCRGVLRDVRSLAV